MRQIKVLAISGLACVLAAGLLIMALPTSKPPDLQELLGNANNRTQQRLYSGARNAKTGALLTLLDESVEIDLPHTRFITYKDRSTEDQLLVPNSQHMLSSRLYFPVQLGEDGRRLHIARTFVPNLKGAGDELSAEEVRRLSGTLAQQTIVLADKRKHIVDYADDGVVLIGDQWYATPDCCGGPVLQTANRWRNDSEHTLSYSNVLNHDGTRTVVDYDEKHHPLKVANWSEYGSVAGTTVEGYYPVTYKPRFSSKSDYNSDLVSYFHEDGSLWYKLDIGTSTVTVKYFDQTGTRELLEQMWWRHEVTTNGVTHVTYSLYTLAFWDDQGNKTRSMSFSEKGVVDFETLYDVTVGGVKYKELDNFYNPDGTLKETRYWIGEAHFPPDKIEPHQVQENIRAQVPADALTMHVQIDDDLPIPPPQTGPEGY